MSAQIVIARNIFKGRIEHIDEVPFESKEVFICCGCNTQVGPVKTEQRGKEWHFRHQVTFDVNKCRNRSLHDYAVQVICDSTAIVLSKDLKIEYTFHRTEYPFPDNEFRSDATVHYNNDLLHFEVFVHNDVTPRKERFYRRNNIKGYLIDLSDETFQVAPKEQIKDVVLNHYNNKAPLVSDKPDIKEQPTQWYEKVENWVIIGVIVMIVRYIWKRITR